MKYIKYYMDKFVTNSDKNTGLTNVANINNVNRTRNLSEMHTRQKDYNNVLNKFKLDMTYKINRFDPSKLKTNNDIDISNLWFRYIFNDITKRDYASILNICNIHYTD